MRAALVSNAAILAACTCVASAALAERPAGSVRRAESAKALGQQLREAASEGGVVEIPEGAPPDFVPDDAMPQRIGGPAVTILDRRGGANDRIVSPVGTPDRLGFAGERIRRKLNLGRDSLPPMGIYSNLSLQNRILSGSSSYYSTLSQPVGAGSAQRFYVETIRGIYPGQKLIVRASSGSAEGMENVTVASIEWDRERRAHYFTANVRRSHPAGSHVYDKHVVNALQIDSYSNADNQTPGEVFLRRRNYGLGDAFLFSGWLSYMSDINSGLGDEGAIVFNAETIGDLGSFRGTVERLDWSDDELVYRAGPTNAHTLSPSRPLVNLNTRKWIDAGRAYVVRPWNRYKGASGVILGSPDAPWTQDVIGRFFAVTEPSEVISRGDGSSGGGFLGLPAEPVYRWYPIVDFEQRPDGSKLIRVQRVVWQTYRDVPQLFRDDHYSHDAREVPLRYAIAPGAWVYDVSRGWADVEKQGGVVPQDHPRALRVAAAAERSTRFDFEPGDPIVQAVGPEPFRPYPMRIRHFDELPGSNHSASIFIKQDARVQVSDALWVMSSTRTRPQLEQRKDRKAPYESILNVETLATYGIRFRSEVLQSAIEFEQPNGFTQPIGWSHRRDGKPGRVTLRVPPDSGDFVFEGGHVDVSDGGVKRVKGLSATATAPRNLRGIDVAVAPGQRRLEVRFREPERDASYAVSISPSWVTSYGVTAKRPDGFVVEFGGGAPASARLDWLLVR